MTPEVDVYTVEGRSKEVKRALLKDITNAVANNLRAAPDLVTVLIVEARAI